MIGTVIPCSRQSIVISVSAGNREAQRQIGTRFTKFS